MTERHTGIDSVTEIQAESDSVTERHTGSDSVTERKAESDSVTERHQIVTA